MKYYPFDPKITKKDLEQGWAVSNAFWNACSMALMNEKENKMATVKYDVGDILTWSKDGNCYATVVIVSWHTKDMYVEGISLKRYTDYNVFLKSHEKDDFELAHGVPECAFCNYKVVGHIDISGMPNDEVKTHLDCAIAIVWKTAWSEYVIAYAVQAHWALMKLHEPKEESEYVKMGFCIPKASNPFYYDNLADKLAEECKQKQKHLDLANNKILELKKEVDSLRQMLRNDSTRIHKNLSEMGFTEDAICSIMYSEFNYKLGTE